MNTSRGESNSDPLRKKKSDQVKGRRRRADLVELEPLVVGRVEDALDVGLPLGGERRVGEDEVEARRDVGGPLPHHLLPHDLPARPEPVQAQEPRPPRPLRRRSRPRPLLPAKAPHPSFRRGSLRGRGGGEKRRLAGARVWVWLARRGGICGDRRGGLEDLARGRGRLLYFEALGAWTAWARGGRGGCGGHTSFVEEALYATDDVANAHWHLGPTGGVGTMVAGTARGPHGIDVARSVYSRRISHRRGEMGVSVRLALAVEGLRPQVALRATTGQSYPRVWPPSMDVNAAPQVVGQIRKRRAGLVL